MRATKRLAFSEPNTDTNETAFRNKRIMDGSPFDVHRAEPSQQLVVATPQLDTQRAESSQRHVRALNVQFASWVQTQLKNNPDELWEDGVRDYLAHASSIMEKFSDVVNWLKANASKGENLPPTAPYAGNKQLSEVANAENNSFAANKENNILGANKENNIFGANKGNNIFGASEGNNIFGANKGNSSFGATNFGEKTVITPASTTTTTITTTPPTTTSFASSWNPGVFSNTVTTTTPTLITPVSTTTTTLTTTSFASSWSPGVFSNNQNPVLFGSQTSVPSQHDASNDEDDENDLERPSSPSVKKSEEKGIVVVHEVKCKLYVKSSDPTDDSVWKDKGMGQLSIRCKEGVSKATKESKPTIIIRNEVGKILLNALLYPGIKTNTHKNSLVAIFHTSGNADGNEGDKDSVVARTFLIRLKTEEDRNRLATAIQEYAPVS